MKQGAWTPNSTGGDKLRAGAYDHEQPQSTVFDSFEFAIELGGSLPEAGVTDSDELTVAAGVSESEMMSGERRRA